MSSKPRKIPMADIATSLLEVAGLGFLIAFAYVVWPPAALAVTAFSLLGISWRLSGSPLPPRRPRAVPDPTEGIL